ncbi:MAG: threonine ammonia-lyase [Myxococcales bacterium]|nr:threonine ammonia-lyase [Myxococcales bacterium]MCB9732300.1 threonine ammonia-lyase [Deltaproteobacteria bacterium]
MVEFADVESAREVIRGHTYLTPCAHSATLSRMTGAKVYLKLENLQMTGSYKERGALNRIARLDDDERARGVVASSAGNHAQGVAYHATRLGIRSTIVMPTYTPLIKVTSTRRYGADVILHGDSYDAAYAEARRIADETGAVFVHPFDDPAIVAGQGTVGLELLEQNPYLDAVVVPVGGGGLIAGMAIALKAINPRIRVYGVESAAMPGMKRSLEAGHVVSIAAQRTLAEGIAVRRVGDIAFDICRQSVDDIVTVDDEEIASAVLTLLEVEKTVAEGAGAVALAALMAERLPVKGKKVALVLTGGNIDVTVLARIIQRGLVKDGRMGRFEVALPDVPGALARLTDVVARAGANIMHITHNRAFIRGPLGETIVTLELETRSHDHITEILGVLTGEGFNVTAS